jgi:hypothetical protein|tara:strand:+ start:2077 stop:2265 length:189 start_codon:yes stop_codon:yes gene_type:complete
MNIFLLLFALLGGSQNNQSFDPASILVKQIVKGVYDETRVQTLAVIEEKNALDYVDKIRILE